MLPVNPIKMISKIIIIHRSNTIPPYGSIKVLKVE